MTIITKQEKLLLKYKRNTHPLSMGGRGCCIQVLGSRDSALRAGLCWMLPNIVMSALAVFTLLSCLTEGTGLLCVTELGCLAKVGQFSLKDVKYYSLIESDDGGGGGAVPCSVPC